MPQQPPEQLVFIPSTNNVSLEARIGVPCTSTTARKDICLILTHPYGKLGGNLQNNVVEALRHSFSKEFITVRFNFRGVGQSTGRGSFSGSGEVDDLASVCKYVKARVDLNPKYFVLVGYSYGTIPVCALSSELEGCIGVVAISFPASVMWFLTMGNGNKYIDALRACPQSTPKLLIMGDCDNFTGIKAFQQFADTVPERKKIEIVDGMDHFWFDREDALVECIRKWLRSEKVVPEKTKGTPLPPLGHVRNAQPPMTTLRAAKSVDSLHASSGNVNQVCKVSKTQSDVMESSDTLKESCDLS
ncbi:hypothetical protein CcCBS67573_g06177 [Chytriomyces confervae]|uniref:AB hydrolase-1 domain-containing protein n=1 Tax=Chytriomyces confervae TaxID=246404 RepID=A0A507F622_9FUNG|nr:hypothetical protein HDU80_003210 [Chytriomyces hyalinus]TPX71562.1 hypothetical protein CcCBS67573_g06177 [Chytriomyces confervae]